MSTLIAFQHNLQGTSRHHLLRMTNGWEVLDVSDTDTEAQLLDKVLALDDKVIYDEESKCWQRCDTGNVVAVSGDTSADLGDYGIVIYNMNELASDDHNLIGALYRDGHEDIAETIKSNDQ